MKQYNSDHKSSKSTIPAGFLYIISCCLLLVFTLLLCSCTLLRSCTLLCSCTLLRSC